jgi:ATP-dependent DNA helicase PIF1
MCIRNVDVSRGLINGTMLELLAIGQRFLQVRIMSGIQSGNTDLLTPCMFNITSEASGLPFAITRRQYPIILAFCLSVHKAQGQTLKVVGLIFETDPFAHGQLYVALSRVANWACVQVVLPQGVTSIVNLVYQHLLFKNA